MLVLHAGVVLLLAGHMRQPPAVRAGTAATTWAPPLTWLRLLPEPRPIHIATPAAPENPSRRPEGPDRPAPRLAPGHAVLPQAISVAPAPDAALVAGAVPTAEAPSPALPPASAPPLDLRLPRRSAASAPASALARSDERISPALNHEERMARALGTDNRLVEQVTAAGRRFIRGNSCVEVRPNRSGQLDPFNGSVQPKPSFVGAC